MQSKGSAFLPRQAPLLISLSPRYYGNRKLPQRASGADPKGPSSSQVLAAPLMGGTARDPLKQGNGRRGRRQTGGPAGPHSRLA